MMNESDIEYILTKIGFIRTSTKNSFLLIRKQFPPVQASIHSMNIVRSVNQLEELKYLLIHQIDPPTHRKQYDFAVEGDISKILDAFSDSRHIWNWFSPIISDELKSIIKRDFTINKILEE